MKKIFLFIFFFNGVTSVFGQRCTQPVSDGEFESHFNDVTSVPYEQARFVRARNFLKGHCFTCKQILQIVAQLSDDNDRLIYSKESYFHVIDKENFYDLYNVMYSLASTFRLDHFVQEVKEKNWEGPPPTESQNSFPNINYPIASIYKGKTGCNLPMADIDFEVLTRPLLEQKNQNILQNSCNQFVVLNCVSMAQLMKLSSLFDLEIKRLEFLKASLMRVYDMENYAFAGVLFSHEPYKNDWLSYGASKCPVVIPETAPPLPPPCRVAPNELDEIIKSVDSEVSGITKVAVAKQVIAAKKCFSVNQLKQIVNLLISETSKLDLAKYAYDYCTNKEDYYQMKDVFNSSYNKTELINYIKTKK